MKAQEISKEDANFISFDGGQIRNRLHRILVVGVDQFARKSGPDSAIRKWVDGAKD